LFCHFYLHFYVNVACVRSLFMQHAHVECSCCMSMQPGHAALISSMDLQNWHGQAVWKWTGTWTYTCRPWFGTVN
jgi:hypothetical protein